MGAFCAPSFPRENIFLLYQWSYKHTGGTLISSFLCGGDNLVPIAVSCEVDRWHQAVIK